MDSPNDLDGPEPGPLAPGERCVFDLSPATMMVISARDGQVLAMNQAGRKLFGAALSVKGLRVEGEADRLLLQVEGDHRRLPLRCMPLGGREDVFLAALADELRPELGGDSPVERVLPSLGILTSRILHDVRNLIFPLACHMDLAMASVDTTSEAYTSLLEVQAACRRCEEELDKLSALSVTQAGSERFVHVEDVLERAALLLRYILPRKIEIDIQVEDATHLIRVSPTGFQRLLIDLAALAHDRREQAEGLALSARSEGDDVLLTLHLDSPRPGRPEDFEHERRCIEDVLAREEVPATIELNIEVEAAALDFEVRIKSPATASTSQLESRGIESGRGERVIILHHQPMMRDLMRNYLDGKGYACSTRATLEALLEDLRDGVDAVVADASTEEVRQLVRTIETGGAPGLAALIVCRGQFDDRAPAISSRRLDHPFRMDEVAAALRNLLDTGDSPS